MSDALVQQVPENITVSDWDPTGWRTMSADDAIHSLFAYADTEAKKVVAWYEKAKRRKAKASSTIRGLAIVLFVVGGLAPILAGFLHNTTAWMVVITQCGYLILGIAAGFLAFDRYFGMSSGWIRYMTTLAGIERLRAEFLFDWAALLQKAPATIDDATKLLFLARAQAFQKSVLELVEKETAAWVAEFQSSVADLEKVVQAQKQAAEANLQAVLKQEAEIRERLKREEQTVTADRRPGAVNVEVEGDMDGPMEILLDGGKVRETTARTTALLNLSKGQHAIEVRGVNRGASISASKVVTIEPGMIAELKLKPH